MPESTVPPPRQVPTVDNNLQREFSNLQKQLFAILKVDTTLTNNIELLSLKLLQKQVAAGDTVINFQKVSNITMQSIESIIDTLEEKLSTLPTSTPQFQQLQEQVNLLKEISQETELFNNEIENINNKLEEFIGNIPLIPDIWKKNIVNELSPLFTPILNSINNVKQQAESIWKKIPTIAKVQLLAIVGLVYKAFSYLEQWDEATQDFIRSMGMGRSELVVFEKQVRSTWLELKKMGASMNDIMDITKNLTYTFGSVEAKDWIKTAAIIQQGFGISAENAAKIVTLQVASMGLTQKQIEANMVALKKLSTHYGISANSVISEIADNSETVALFWHDTGQNIIKASVFANTLGASLKDTLNIAESLLDIEQSTQKAMQAQVMLGITLDVNEARRLAMHGDIAEAQKLLLDQLVDQVDIENLNYFTLKSVSEVLGVSADRAKQLLIQYQKNREELEKMPSLLQEYIAIGNRAEPFAQKLGIKDMLSDFNKLTKMMGASFAPFLAGITSLLSVAVRYIGIAFSFIAGIIEKIQSNKIGNIIIQGIVPAFILLNLTLFRSFGLIGKLFSGITGLIGGAVKGTVGLIGKLTGLDTVAARVFPKLDKIMGIETKRPRGRPAHRGLLDNLIGRVSPQQILASAVALMALAGAIWIISKSLQNLTGIEWKQVAMLGTIVGGLVVTMTALGAVMASPIGWAMIAGVAALSVTLISLGIAIIPITKRLKTLSDSFESLIFNSTKIGDAAKEYKNFFEELNNINFTKLQDNLNKIIKPIDDAIDKTVKLRNELLKTTAIEAASTTIGGIVTIVKTITEPKGGTIAGRLASVAVAPNAELPNIKIVPADVVLDGKKIGSVVFKAMRGD